jgi:hypothetical protein
MTKSNTFGYSGRSLCLVQLSFFFFIAGSALLHQENLLL